MEKVKIWIARDGERGRNDGELFLYDNLPKLGAEKYIYLLEITGQSIPLEAAAFPEIGNSECWEFELKDGKKI